MIQPIQLVLVVFLVFAISRVYLRVKDGSLKYGEFAFWMSLFFAAFLGVVDPSFSTYVAQLLGIGRGTDVVVYMSIVLLFYLIFRLTVMIENLRHEITKVVRQIALQNQETPSKVKKKKT